MSACEDGERAANSRIYSRLQRFFFQFSEAILQVALSMTRPNGRETKWPLVAFVLHRAKGWRWNDHDSRDMTLTSSDL
jgi:hypothetical protein